MRNMLVAALFLAVRTANADQCAVVSADQAQAAAKLLTDVAVQLYCAPCGDAKPSFPSTSVAHKVRAHDGRVDLEGKDVDLAYVYAKTGPTTFTNVGLMVGCGAKDVVPFLDFAAGADLVLLQHEYEDLSKQIDRAIDAVARAQSARDRDAANAQLKQLRAQREDVAQKLAVAKADAARRERNKGVTIRKECRDNPLAKGCE